TDAQLLSLGLSPRPTRAARAAPAGAPVVDVAATMGRVAILRVREAGSIRVALPFGALGANLYSFVGPTSPADPRDYHFHGMTTRARTQITFDNDVPNGAMVWLSARWVGARGRTSAASEPVCFPLPGGSALPVAA